MNGLVMQSSETPPPELPVWVVVFFAVCAVGCALNHWRFRRGWKMDREYYRGDSASQELAVMCGYISLPGAVSAASMGMLTTVYILTVPTTSWAVGYTIMFLFGVSVMSGVWMAKEWLKPTERRTPDWLR